MKRVAHTMIEEYARHHGHADLLREPLNGPVVNNLPSHDGPCAGSRGAADTGCAAEGTASRTGQTRHRLHGEEACRATLAPHSTIVCGTSEIARATQPRRGLRRLRRANGRSASGVRHGPCPG